MGQGSLVAIFQKNANGHQHEEGLVTRKIEWRLALIDVLEFPDWHAQGDLAVSDIDAENFRLRTEELKLKSEALKKVSRPFFFLLHFFGRTS